MIDPARLDERPDPTEVGALVRAQPTIRPGPPVRINKPSGAETDIKGMATNTAADVIVPSAVTEDAPAGVEEPRVMSLLRQHIPLTLLCDLSATGGPQSRQILDEEGRPETTWWRQ